MAVAMKDLGKSAAPASLLGGEQSGHIADVGFDLYIRLVGEAVAEFRGRDVEPEPEVRIEVLVEAHPADRLCRIGAAAARDVQTGSPVRAEADVKALEAELADRYGDPAGRSGEPDGRRPVPAAGQVGRLLTEIVSQGTSSASVRPSCRNPRLRLQRLYPRRRLQRVSRTRAGAAPMSSTIGGDQVRDSKLLDWCARIITDIFSGPDVGFAGGPARDGRHRWILGSPTGRDASAWGGCRGLRVGRRVYARRTRSGWPMSARTGSPSNRSTQAVAGSPARWRRGQTVSTEAVECHDPW
jgi:hypothetical protein